MAQVLIRNIDDEILDIHRRRAKARGQSLEQELRDVLADGARPSVEERLALVRKIRAMTPKNIEQTDSALMIREDRDSR